VDGADIVLVDDVIMSGRTIRAALNELFDFGRPNSVALVTLIDLADNDLPIRPDVAGIKLNLAPNQRIKLTGPDPLALSLQTLSSGSP
jgi:pyrimidine operon attenuation protein/uracil phosphoribosyltransferase